MADTPIDLLQQWLMRQLPEPAGKWLGDQLAMLQADPSDRTLHIALGMVPRRLGKDDLALEPGDLAAAEAARPGWDPRGWSVDQAARILILCSLGARNEDFAGLFSNLCQTADAAEAITLYSGLPLYPAPESLEAQAAEGLRTNMRAIFEAVAHDSPFPRERFDENRWNHMVLKALFIDSRLAPIQGLDERANPELARIMRDYAHERWAAGRPVTPELWRCVGPFADSADALSDLKRLAESPLETDRQAAALALSASPAPEAADLLGSMEPALADAIASGALTWNSLSEKL
ncbi:MAG TPA: EboA domain-containing protein [Afifellaceae bacterium]|nr:EboA domain-containing protein [Afifellaceae bacterium]